MTLDQLVAQINALRPGRDWDQWCQRLMWNCVYIIMGYERDSQVADQGSATIARKNSVIESTNASAAPTGAMHWFLYPADGHVGMSLGGSKVLMTGTPQALGKGSYQCGTNYGVTTVEAYSKAKGNPYLGWSRTNGKNPSLIGKLNTGGSSGGTKVIHYKKQDKNARSNGRVIAPGKSLYLHESIDNPAHASNVVGAVGSYSITPHVYAEGTPGDRIVLKLRWQHNPQTSVARTSDHYEQTLELDADGKLKDTREFKGYVGSPKEPVAVFVHVAAHPDNKGPVKITLLDCDSYLFV